MCLGIARGPEFKSLRDYLLPLLDIIKFGKARSVLFLVRERLYIHSNKYTMNDLLGIGNFEKFEFENTPVSESSVCVCCVF